MITGVNINKEIDVLFPVISSKKGEETLLEEDAMFEKQLKLCVFRGKMSRIFQGYQGDSDEGGYNGKKIEISPLLIHNDVCRVKNLVF